MTASVLAITISLGLLHVFVIFGFALVERRTPAAPLAWLFALVFLPGLGVLLYVGFGRRRLVRRRTEVSAVRLRVRRALQAHDRATGGASGRTLEAADVATAGMIALARNTAGAGASTGNRTRLLLNAATTYREMLAAFAAAQDHIHVLFYIIQPDATGRRMRDALTARATDGVEVRVLYDAVGSMSLPAEFWAPLEKAGGRTAAFAPVGLWHRLRRRDRIDFRNHRKIIVADGRIAFTGGINVGREYLGLNPEIGRWRDTHVALEGPSVLVCQRTFAEDWLDATSELLDGGRYYPETPPLGDDATATVVVVPSGPDQFFAPMHLMHFHAIASARSRVWITSPYFVPDPVIEVALITAALRGVDVRLLLPARSDSLLVTLASRAYYPDLLKAGVRIFEYERGFVHAKTLVVDDWLGSVGSANMDIRSFHLNFEINAFVLESTATNELAGHFANDLTQAREIAVAEYQHIPYVRRLTMAAAKLMSPLL